MQLNDRTANRIHWPAYPELQINGRHVQVIRRPGQQLLGANGRDEGHAVGDAVRETGNFLRFQCGDLRPSASACGSCAAAPTRRSWPSSRRWTWGESRYRDEEGGALRGVGQPNGKDSDTKSEDSGRCGGHGGGGDSDPRGPQQRFEDSERGAVQGVCAHGVLRPAHAGAGEPAVTRQEGAVPHVHEA